MHRNSKRWFIVVVSTSLVAGLLYAATWCVKLTIRAADAARLDGQLASLIGGLHHCFNYGDGYPLLHTADDRGKRLHSWRLPSLLKLDAPAFSCSVERHVPWDDSTNVVAYAKLASAAEPVFAKQLKWNSERRPTYFVGLGVTSHQAVDRKTDAGRIVAIVAVEESGIPWNEPRDMSIETLTKHVLALRLASVRVASLNGPPESIDLAGKSANEIEAILEDVVKRAWDGLHDRIKERW